MQRRFLLSAAAIGSAAMVAGRAFAQTGTVDETKLPALMGGDFATATSQLALDKTGNASVRTFAELEIAEQAATAEAFGSEPGAAGLSQEHSAMLAQLEALEGAEFDAMYLDGQIKGHNELLAIHQAYASDGEDPMARGASIVGVAGIQTHLVMLNGIRQTIG